MVEPPLPEEVALEVPPRLELETSSLSSESLLPPPVLLAIPLLSIGVEEFDPPERLSGELNCGGGGCTLC